ncbi:hypothetical protein [Edaphobacter aggregans]|uniref:hypothetical protein n=1 Tax=Edaphobacter aggregans TaxID=570835 RepID=UPI0005580C01|nr:hypothetical protein [Edaphobacter aggregans]
MMVAMDDSGILSEERLVRENDRERIARTIEIVHGPVMRYQVRIQDIVIENAVVSRRDIDTARGHFDIWEEAQRYVNERVKEFRAAGFEYEPVTKKLLRRWTLYSDIPQRHYRQIAARSENDAFLVLVFEGNILRVKPFAKQPVSRERYEFKAAELALKKAEEIYKSSLANGWSDYHPVYG